MCVKFPRNQPQRLIITVVFAPRPLVRLLGGLAGLGTAGMVAGWACWVAIWDSVLLNTDRAVPEADATPDDEAPCNFLLPVWYCRFLARGRDRLKGFVVVVFWAGVPTRLRRLLLFSTWGWLPFNCGFHCCCVLFVARFLVVVPSMMKYSSYFHDCHRLRKRKTC